MNRIVGRTLARLFLCISHPVHPVHPVQSLPAGHTKDARGSRGNSGRSLQQQLCGHRRFNASFSHRRSGVKAGANCAPERAISSANSSSYGAHTRTSEPSSRNFAASPASGCTSPRDPNVDSNTRIGQLLCLSLHGARLCRTTWVLPQDPRRIYVDSGKGRTESAFPFFICAAHSRAQLIIPGLPCCR